MQEDNDVQIRSFLEGIRIRLGLENKESTPEKSDVQIGSLLEGIRFRLGLENKESTLDLRNDSPSTPPQELVVAPDPMVLFIDAQEKFQSTMKSGLDGLRDEIRELRVAFHVDFNEMIQKIVNIESESIPVLENSALSIDDVLGAKSIQERDSMGAEELGTKTELFDEVTERDQSQSQSQSQVPNSFLESRPGNRMLSELGMGLVFSYENMEIKHVENPNFDDILEISRVFQEESLEAQQMEQIDVLHVENVAEIFELLTSIMISLSAYQLFDNMFSRGRIEIQQMIVRKMPKSWKFKYKRRRNHHGTDSNGNTELLEAIGDIEEQQEILIQHQKVELLQLQLFNGKDAANIVWWLLHFNSNEGVSGLAESYVNDLPQDLFAVLIQRVAIAGSTLAPTSINTFESGILVYVVPIRVSCDSLAQ